MASRTCAHCGELFEDEGRLVCPHCGADADLTYTPEPSEFDFGQDEEGEYQETLEREGLTGEAGRTGKGRGCLLLVLLLPAGVSFLFIWSRLH